MNLATLNIPHWLTDPLIVVGNYDLTGLELIAVPSAILLTLAGSRFLSKEVLRITSNIPSFRKDSAYILSRLCYFSTLIIGTLITVSILGVPVSDLAILGGALSVGIGFGLQSIVSNFVSGLIILFDRSLKINDYVQLDSGVRGVVSEITMRYTRITTNDEVDILVPNSEFITGKVINCTHSEDQRRIHIPFGVAYGSDKELVRKAVIEAALRVPFTETGNKSERHPEVWLVRFGESSLDFELVVWLNSEATRKQERAETTYMWEIHNALVAHHIEIPFPQRDLHIRSSHIGSLAPQTNEKPTSQS